MESTFSRTELLLGKEAMQKLADSRVIVFGAGGVGGYCIEALARTGVGEIDIVDNDEVAPSNINRQIIALCDTVGMNKAKAACERIKRINPDIKANALPMFFTKDNADSVDFEKYDYIVDAIDTVSSKILLAELAQKYGVPIISSMGAGNKLCPQAFEVSDIYKTSVCPLARVMRLELKKRGIKKLKVVYSKEKPIKTSAVNTDPDSKRRSIPGSVAFVPSVAGLIIAGEVIKDITGVREQF